MAVASAKQNWHEVQPGNTPCRKLCAKFRCQASVGGRLIQEFLRSHAYFSCQDNREEREVRANHARRGAEGSRVVPFDRISKAFARSSMIWPVHGCDASDSVEYRLHRLVHPYSGSFIRACRPHPRVSAFL